MYARVISSTMSTASACAGSTIMECPHRLYSTTNNYRQDCSISQTDDSRFAAVLATITAVQKTRGIENAPESRASGSEESERPVGMSVCRLAVAIAAFGVGAYVGHYRAYSRTRFSVKRQSGSSRNCPGCDKHRSRIRFRWRGGCQSSRTAEVAANRIRDTDALTAGLLWAGGEGMFREYCPERGCLAVEFSPTGDVVHAYPYRLDRDKRLGENCRLCRGGQRTHFSHPRYLS